MPGVQLQPKSVVLYVLLILTAKHISILYALQAHEWRLSFFNIGGKKMDFGRGLILWLLGVPLPVILLIALFWHH